MNQQIKPNTRYKPSHFANLRSFHNNIKRQMYNKYTKGIGNLLELAVGKGGDLSKINQNKVKHTVGYDINDESIIEAKRRLKDGFPSYFQNSVELYTLDLSKNVLPEPQEKVDIVSSMFAFHYFFENRSAFETVMQSILNNIKPGGYFIGAFFDGKSVLEKIHSKDFVYYIKENYQLTDLFGENVTWPENPMSIDYSNYIIFKDNIESTQKEIVDEFYNKLYVSNENPLEIPWFRPNVTKQESNASVLGESERTPFLNDTRFNIVDKDSAPSLKTLLSLYTTNLQQKYTETDNENYLKIIKQLNDILLHNPESLIDSFEKLKMNSLNEPLPLDINWADAEEYEEELVDLNKSAFKLAKQILYKSLFNHRIGVFLEGTVLGEQTDEFIVEFESFTKVMELLGFKLIETNMFEDFYNDKFNLDPVEKECSFLNRTFVFQKL
jgi:SAM-dependent methyltransferase